MDPQRDVDFDKALALYVSTLPPPEAEAVTNNAKILWDQCKKYKYSYSRQFAALMAMDDDVTAITALAELIMYFTSPWGYKDILLAIHRNPQIEDHKIIHMIKSNRNRVNKRDYNWQVSQIALGIYRTKSSGVAALLDIGCGNGSKTLSIGTALRKLYANNLQIDGADLATWGPYNQRNIQYSFNFKTIQVAPEYRIDAPDQSYDVIMTILTLHHAQSIESVLREVHRLLRPGGLFVVIEHNVWHPATHMAIDLQHKIYTSLKNEKHEPPGTYYNEYEWFYILQKQQGITPRTITRITEDVSGRQRYDQQIMIICERTE